MAEELMDKVVAFKGDVLKHAGPCVTKGIKLVGGEGYHTLLHVQLVQVGKNVHALPCASTPFHALPRPSVPFRDDLP